METSRDGIRFIARREALVLVAYQDGPHMSIGFGSNDPKLKAGDTITVQQAFALLIKDVRRREHNVEAMLKNSVVQHEFDALVSLYYQGGNDNLRPIVALLNSRYAALVPAVWVMLDKNLAGEPLPGLRRRRELERAVFETGDYGSLSPLPLWRGDPKTTQPEQYHVKDEDLP